ncbi:MAG: 2-phospho-L-lactate transferase [Pseudomonadota bacterium]
MSHYLALTGGVGGAKLALGLTRVLPPEELTLVVNTGDDFEHLGLHIAPDIDTLTYTLSGLANAELGWGRGDESWNCLDTLGQLGGETWFQLGDRDLALHLRRTALLRAGHTLTEVTAVLSQQLGIEPRILPMSDDPVRTIVHSNQGRLSFQHYFVREQCKPRVEQIEFEGAATARPAPGLLEAIASCDAIIICPSNPFLSVDPVLSVPGVRQALLDTPAPVVAVSPIVGGTAVKGPTAKIMHELNLATMADEIANHYGELIDLFVLDELDKFLDGQLPVQTLVAQTVMRTLEDREQLARVVLAAVGRPPDPQ